MALGRFLRSLSDTGDHRPGSVYSYAKASIVILAELKLEAGRWQHYSRSKPRLPYSALRVLRRRPGPNPASAASRLFHSIAAITEELMALREKLLAGATCPVCLDVFEQPVVTTCGHSFCGQCLAAVLGDPPRPAACPQCRAPLEPGSQNPSRTLGDLAEDARSLEEVAARPRCPQHGKVLALFCEPCAALLCAPCRDGPEHRGHRVRPAEEAARELQETLQRNLLSLQEQKENLNHRGDQKSEDLQVTARSELQRVAESFEELQQCLEEQKETLQAQLVQMSHELVSKSKEYTHRVLERQSLLDTVIAQIQEKEEQPAVEFLKDVGTILSSCEAAMAPIPVSPELQKSIQSLTDKSQQVMAMVDKFRVNMCHEIDLQREQVRLDPDTAHPRLLLLDDNKEVWFRKEKPKLPDNPKRFTGSYSVLGSQGFTSGRHYWEVEVGEEGSWAVGVALESVPRKEPICHGSSEKAWVLQLHCGHYGAQSVSSESLALKEKLRRIRVCLHYEMGRVTFYNARDMTQIIQVEANFTEKVFPYFLVSSEGTHIRVCH
ncbi:E3 ubiquitin-protein ligase TRIM7-like [Ammospiza maritima maritima]